MVSDRLLAELVQETEANQKLAEGQGRATAIGMGVGALGGLISAAATAKTEKELRKKALRNLILFTAAGGGIGYGLNRMNQSAAKAPATGGAPSGAPGSQPAAAAPAAPAGPLADPTIAAAIAEAQSRPDKTNTLARLGYAPAGGAAGTLAGAAGDKVFKAPALVTNLRSGHMTPAVEQAAKKLGLTPDQLKAVAHDRGLSGRVPHVRGFESRLERALNSPKLTSTYGPNIDAIGARISKKVMGKAKPTVRNLQANANMLDDVALGKALKKTPLAGAGTASREGLAAAAKGPTAYQNYLSPRAAKALNVAGKADDAAAAAGTGWLGRLRGSRAARVGGRTGFALGLVPSVLSFANNTLSQGRAVRSGQMPPGEFIQ